MFFDILIPRRSDQRFKPLQWDIGKNVRVALGMRTYEIAAREIGHSQLEDSTLCGDQEQ